jgi:pilus assembly protein CpaE
VAISTNVVVLCIDARFREEMESALGSLSQYRATGYFATNLHEAIKAVRNRRPRLVIVEIGGDLADVKSLADELSAVAPDTALAGAILPEVYSAAGTESTLLLAAVRAGVKDFLRRPVSSTELGDLLGRVLKSGGTRGGAAPGKIVTFVSNKGGVGKSTLAVNAACGLALRRPERVLLIDLSIQMGVCASMLDVRPPATITDAARQHDRLDETLLRQVAIVHSSGLHLLAAPSGAVEAAEIDDEFVIRLLTLARRAYDFVVVDTFPMIDRVMLAVLDLSDRAYVVVENVVPTLLGAIKFVELLDGLGVDRSRQRVVLNRFTSLPGSLPAADVAQRLGREVDFVLPADKHVVIAANAGEPYVMRASRWFGYGPPLRRLVADLDALSSAPAATIVPDESLPVAENGSAPKGQEQLA